MLVVVGGGGGVPSRLSEEASVGRGGGGGGPVSEGGGFITLGHFRHCRRAVDVSVAYFSGEGVVPPAAALSQSASTRRMHTRRLQRPAQRTRDRGDAQARARARAQAHTHRFHEHPRLFGGAGATGGGMGLVRRPVKLVGLSLPPLLPPEHLTFKGVCQTMALANPRTPGPGLRRQSNPPPLITPPPAPSTNPQCYYHRGGV